MCIEIGSWRAHTRTHTHTHTHTHMHTHTHAYTHIGGVGIAGQDEEDMTHACAQRESFIRPTWLKHMQTPQDEEDMTHACVRRGSFICATWLKHMQTLTHPHDCIAIVKTNRTWLMHEKTPLIRKLLQGGKDSKAALGCRSFFAKEPLIIGLFCRKGPVKIRQRMTLCHPVGSWYVRKFMKHKQNLVRSRRQLVRAHAHGSCA